MKRFYIPKSRLCMQYIMQEGLSDVANKFENGPEPICTNLIKSGRFCDGIFFTYMLEPPVKERLDLKEGVGYDSIGRSTADESFQGVRDLCSKFFNTYSDAVLVFVNCMFTANESNYLLEKGIVSLYHESTLYHIMK